MKLVFIQGRRNRGCQKSHCHQKKIGSKAFFHRIPSMYHYIIYLLLGPKILTFRRACYIVYFKKYEERTRTNVLCRLQRHSMRFCSCALTAAGPSELRDKWVHESTHTTQNSQNKWTKILTLEITIFSLKMMVKSGLEKNILKFHEPLQRYLLTSQANSAILGSSNSEGAHGIS